MISSGSGTGKQTQDGCSVEVYKHLPYLGELEPILPLLKLGTNILELGCGTGRLTRILMAENHTVLAVDESKEMLDELPPNTPMHCSSIEALDLPNQFGAILLASNIINTPTDSMRQKILQVCAKHLRPGGHLFIERHNPDNLRAATLGPKSKLGPFNMEVMSIAHHATHVEMQVEYVRDTRRWTHTFSAAILENKDIKIQLEKCDLDVVKWLGNLGNWVMATHRENKKVTV